MLLRSQTSTKYFPPWLWPILTRRWRKNLASAPTSTGLGKPWRPSEKPVRQSRLLSLSAVYNRQRRQVCDSYSHRRKSDASTKKKVPLLAKLWPVLSIIRASNRRDKKVTVSWVRGLPSSSWQNSIEASRASRDLCLIIRGEATLELFHPPERANRM